MENRDDKQQKDFLKMIQEKQARKIEAQDQGHKNIWMGLGMFGVIGWSIALPTILGIVLGMWLEKHYPGRVPWTITCLFSGLTVGCFNAYYWINKEHKQLNKESKPEGKKDE